MEKLGINPGFLIAQIINFVLVFGLLYWFGWDKLMAFLDRRSEEIAKGLEDARIAAEARANAEADAQKIRADARAEAQKVIAEARASAEERARPIIQAAEEDAARIRAEAQERAREEREAALGNVRGQVVSLSIAAANKLIGEAMDKKQQEKIVNEFFTTATTDIKGLGDGLEVTTALPLSDSEKSSISKSLGGSVATWHVDPSILGGIVVRAGDRVVDGSVRSNLISLSASLN
ncbi:MAG TPA: F0F1 ATP synthase subunit B [Aggregatilineales bacterium]|nr:F0F1 ATP synthase subunit B [Aggregatilineales bacterium]